MALTDNLLAFYKLSDLSDSSGNNRTLTNNGNVSFASGKIGNAANLMGEQSLEVTINEITNASSGSYSCWVNRNGIEEYPLCGIKAFGTSLYFDSYNTNISGEGAGNGGGPDGRLNFGHYTLGEHSVNLNATDWAHFVLAYDATTQEAKCYANGQLFFTGFAESFFSDSNFILGYGDGHQGKGLVDAVGIWNRALNSAEVAALYNSGNGLELTVTPSVNLNSGLQAFYKLDDTSDSSGNGRTLTNNGSVSFASGKIGNAAVFDRQSWLTNSDIQYGTSFSISFWAKYPANSALGVGSVLATGLGTSSNGAGILFAMSDIDAAPWLKPNAVSVIVFNDPGVFPNFYDLNPDEWVHVSYVVNNGIALIYYNAIKDNSYNADISSYLPCENGIILSNSNENFQQPGNNTIDAVGIWNRALSEAEVAALYNSGAGLELTVTPSVNLNSGLQAFYKLDDTSDSSGNGNTLTNNNGVTFASGKIGNAAVFDGSSSNLKSSLVVPCSNSDVTLSLWLKTPSLSQWRTFFGSQFNTELPRINFGTTDMDEIFINNAGSGPVVTLADYTVDDTWQHVVVVITNNGDSVKFYRAGNFVNQFTGVALGSTEVWIGGGVGYPTEADPFNGQIDAVGIWNRALSEAEVAALYNSGTGLELDGQAQSGGVVRLGGSSKFFGRVKFAV